MSIATPSSLASPRLAAVRSEAHQAALQQRFAFAGLLLAAVMVALLYQVLSDNVAAIQNRRLAGEQLARERHNCAMMSTRLARDQCVASVMLPVEPQPSLRPDTTVLAGR